MPPPQLPWARPLGAAVAVAHNRLRFRLDLRRRLRKRVERGNCGREDRLADASHCWGLWASPTPVH
eukprot:612476-Alexandrium_andersonii.AAC.1